jgi:uncharacterized protein
MKLHADQATTTSIQAHGEGWIQVNGQRYTRSVLVTSAQGVQPWDAATFDDLQPEHFVAVQAFEPEVVVFGSGTKLRFPKPATMHPLVQAKTGWETMSTAAACRTFNILAQEGRTVVAALLIEPEST